MTHELESQRHVEAAQALAAAAMQIELALREGQAPVDRLGFLVDGMSETIRELRAVQVAAPVLTEAVASEEVVPPLERLQKDLFLFITQLQFYDRQVQHLTHLQDFITGVANELGAPTEAGESRDVWDELRGKLRKRLISAAQRELLDVTLTPATGVSMTSAEARAEYASAGSAELF
jgi:hypothetical protein